jgi:SNF2 family DNA or RNA helicase
MALKITLSLEGAFAVIRIRGFLGERFGDYRKAIEGAIYNAKAKANYATIDKVPGIIVRLREADFGVDCDEALTRALAEHTTQLWNDVQAAKERARAFDEAMQKRVNPKTGKPYYLYPFQHSGISWLSMKFGALLADDMGLGKTIQTIAAMPANAAVLVVGPAVAKSVWRKELGDWRPHLRVSVLSGRGTFRWPKAGEVVKEVPDNVVMVFDEAHNLKNGNAQRTVRARGLSGAVRAKGGRVWLLTATPLMNHPVELWSVFQAALIAQEVFGDFKTFLRLFNAKAASEFGGYLFGTPETEEIAERMQRVMLRRMKKDVLQELPAKDWRTVTVEVDQKALKACDAYVAKFGGVDKIAETLDKTLDFKTMSMVASALAAAKIPAMLDLVESYEEQEEPLVVFSAHRAPIDVLAKRPGWGVITGDTTNEERGRLVEQFQAGDLKGMGCTIRAGGVAVTLTRSCNMVFVDREWTPALNVQAEDRISRIGQDRPVLITILVADHPLDERVTELTTAKQMLINASVDGAREMQDHDEELAGTGS